MGKLNSKSYENCAREGPWTSFLGPHGGGWTSLLGFFGSVPPGSMFGGLLDTFGSHFAPNIYDIWCRFSMCVSELFLDRFLSGCWVVLCDFLAVPKR